MRPPGNVTVIKTSAATTVAAAIAVRIQRLEATGVATDAGSVEASSAGGVEGVVVGGIADVAASRAVWEPSCGLSPIVTGAMKR